MGKRFYLGRQFRGKFLDPVNLTRMNSHAVHDQFLGLSNILPAACVSEVLAVKFLQHQALRLFASIGEGLLKAFLIFPTISALSVVTP